MLSTFRISTRFCLKLRPRRCGFTLLELLVVVVLMAMMAGAVAISFRGPVLDAQMTNAVSTLRSLDQRMRYTATNHNERKLLVLDLKTGTLENDQNQIRSINLPRSIFIRKVYVSNRKVATDRLQLPYFPDGSSLTWALQLDNGTTSQWVLFAGRSGQMLITESEEEIATVFDTLSKRDDAN